MTELEKTQEAVEEAKNKGMTEEDILLMLMVLNTYAYYESKLTQLNFLEDMFRKIDSAESFEEYKRQIVEDLRNNKTRAEAINKLRELYDNSTANAVLRADNLGTFIYAKNTSNLLEYVAIEDDKVREHHLALSGTIATAKVFEKLGLIPPIEYNCRCSLVVVSRLRALAKTGKINGESEKEVNKRAEPFDEESKVPRGFTSSKFEIKNGVYYHLQDRAKDLGIESLSGKKLSSTAKSYSEEYIKRVYA